MQMLGVEFEYKWKTLPKPCKRGVPVLPYNVPIVFKMKSKRLPYVNHLSMGRGGGQVVSVLAFYSDDPSSNPAEVYNFSVKIVIEKNKNKLKRGRGWPIF